MLKTKEFKKPSQHSFGSAKRPVLQDAAGKAWSTGPTTAHFLQRYLGNSDLQLLAEESPLTGPIAGRADVPGIQGKYACGGACLSFTSKGDEQPTIQPKLIIRPANDIYEQEADRVAEEVMRVPFSRTQGQISPEREEKKMVIDFKANHNQVIPLNKNQQNSKIWQIVHEVLNSPGQPLEPTVRDYMESQFGENFNSVRVHTNERATKSAQALNSLAYTVQQNIVFGPGQYAPRTFQGNKLLAHELAHVVQQLGQRDSFVKNRFREPWPNGELGKRREINQISLLKIPTFEKLVIDRKPRNKSQKLADIQTGSLPYEMAESVEKDEANLVARKALKDFIFGGKPYWFGPSHPWTKMMQKHPHMREVRARLKNKLTEYCMVRERLVPPRTLALSGKDSFSLNEKSIPFNAYWLTKDILSYITMGVYGQESSFAFGSFSLRWEMSPSSYTDLENNEVRGSAVVSFYASDTLTLSSGTRIPMLPISLSNIAGIPNQPFGPHKPINNIPLHWFWIEDLNVSFQFKLDEEYRRYEDSMGGMGGHEGSSGAGE